MKNKKIIIITSIIIALIILVSVAILIFNKYTNETNEEQQTISSENSKVLKIYNELKENGTYKITKTLDEDNEITTMVNGEKAYKEEKVNANVTEYFYENNVMYLLLSYNKTYYTYQNNDTILYENILAFESLTKMEHTTGKEKINKKTYEYEEYIGIQDFLLNTEIALTDLTNAKTRLYFEDEELKYIKTICGDQEEVLSIQISYDIDEEKLQLPSDYTNGEE